MNKQPHLKRTKASGGFTLLEALFAAMLIGLVIAALAVSSGAFTMANANALDVSTAEFLIEEIRALTETLPFDDLGGVAGNYSTPINMDGTPLADFSAYEQRVTMVSCGSEFNAANSDIVRMTVTILKNGRFISEANWIRANLE
jgi:type II secretory pathway pseudopilin PulG